MREASRVSWEEREMDDVAVLPLAGAWPAWQAGARVPREPRARRGRAGAAAGAALQGGAHPEHGPRGPRDHHGGAADLQAQEEAGKRLVVVWRGTPCPCSAGCHRPCPRPCVAAEGRWQCQCTRDIRVPAPCCDTLCLQAAAGDHKVREGALETQLVALCMSENPKKRKKCPQCLGSGCVSGEQQSWKHSLGCPSHLYSPA